MPQEEVAKEAKELQLLQEEEMFLLVVQVVVELVVQVLVVKLEVVGQPPFLLQLLFPVPIHFGFFQLPNLKSEG